MDFSQHIKQELQSNHKVLLSGLGTLWLKVKHAQVNEETQIIQPPKYELAFDLDRTLTAENQFSEFSRTVLNSILQKGEYHVEGIGKWTNEAGKIKFSAEEKENLFTDHFFGFEEIKLSKANNLPSDLKRAEAPSSIFYKIILWGFLVIVPLAGILAFTITQWDKLFSKNIISEYAVKNPAHRIPDKDTLSVSTTKIQEVENLNTAENKNLNPVNEK